MGLPLQPPFPPMDALSVAAIPRPPGWLYEPKGRFRHGTRFLRWRADKAPRRCTMDQMDAAR
ncbi:MAG: hypothetical protein H0V44_00745 [Planctomycetes bacterium]|nr:hypothetical protein [Planctomycetota bacterium]